jgi:hypothetical protein
MLKDLTGQIFSSLKVVSRAANSRDGSAMWVCLCDCGEQRVVAGTGLRAGRNKSCGCRSPRFTSETVRTHGKSSSRIYSIWLGMLARCSPMAKGETKRNYYDKGIRVCDRWKSFDNFLSDMGEPDELCSIDRIDGSKNYYPENCRWATAKVQANNTRTNHIITANGLSMTASMWSDRTGIKANTIIYRIRRGWVPEEAVNPTPNYKKSIEKQARVRLCLACGTPFLPRMTQIKNGVGKFCSQKCNAKQKA